MSKTSLKEIQNYIDNEVKEGRVRIGFEDVNGNLSKLTYIYKRMVTGFMLIKSNYGTKIKTEPIFLCGENNDVSYDLEDYEKVIGTVPTLNCFAVFCLVPKKVSFSKLNVKSHSMKSVLLGFEYPNSEHPDWMEEYKKAFIDSFDYEGKDEETEEDAEDGTEYLEDMDEEAKEEEIEEFLKKCEESSRSGEE